jgi:hypothetical protein
MTTTSAKRGSRKPSGAEKTAPKSVPDWVEKTPDIEYWMEAWLEQSLQEVPLTREEYIALKRHLAKMRGLGEV